MKILTHAGQAHADEIMAIALILIKEKVALDAAEIVRVNNCEPEKCVDADFVVDVGRKHEPANGWFDHHQFPKDAPAECAFTLVANHYGLKRNALSWIERIALLDSKGPWTWFEKTFGRPAKSMTEINLAQGPDVFSWFVHRANASYKNPRAFIDAVEMALDWLRAEMEYIEARPINIDFAQKNMKVLDMGGFKVAHFNQKEMRGIGELCDELSTADPSIVISSKLDDRGEGYSATRWNNSPRVDFLPRKGEKGCIFAHENGFCLKWENDWDGFLNAMKRSVS